MYIFNGAEELLPGNKYIILYKARFQNLFLQPRVWHVTALEDSWGRGDINHLALRKKHYPKMVITI